MVKFMKKSLVLGAGGFIGSHLVERLKARGQYVVGIDMFNPKYRESLADEFLTEDLREIQALKQILSTHQFDYVFQLAADMGGAGYIFTGLNDANVMHNSSQINLNLLHAIVEGVPPEEFPTVFYSSSACVYPEELQTDSANLDLREDAAYPANPDSEYGWEKLFSERLYFAYSRNYGIPVRIARFHNIYGPFGTFEGGKEKVPAAICRKVAQADQGGTVEVWGDGLQSRSFLYIDDCLDAVELFVNQKLHQGPINIGSEEMVSINDLVGLVSSVASKTIEIKHIDGPIGVRGRTSNNDLIRGVLGWDSSITLQEGISRLYPWVEGQLKG
jgi:GDP-D-mannose 3',5'-epimerase